MPTCAEWNVADWALGCLERSSSPHVRPNMRALTNGAGIEVEWPPIMIVNIIGTPTNNIAHFQACNTSTSHRALYRI